MRHSSVISVISGSGIIPARLGSQIKNECLRLQQTQSVCIQKHSRNGIDDQWELTERGIQCLHRERAASIAFAPPQVISGNRMSVSPAAAECQTGDIFSLLELFGKITLVVKTAEG